MVKVNIGAQSFPLPETWDDVISSGRFMDVLKILALSSSLDQQEIFEKVIYLYSDGALECTEIPEQLVVPAAMQVIDECYPALAFLFKSYCISCPLPVIRHKGINYVGKGPRLMPMTGREMEECAWAYSEYQSTGDMKMLDHLIAMLYKPKGLSIVRKLLRSDLATLHPFTKMAIKFWYEQCETWWYMQYKGLYERSGGSSGPSDSLAIPRLIRALAGPTRGTVEAVRLMPRDEIYFELVELERERAEMEAART